MDQASFIETAIEGFGALAQPTRLQALRLLLAAHPESIAAGEIARRCEVPHNTMSNHLAILARAGLIAAEKDGRTVNYRADVAGFRGLIDFLARDCCSGKPELCGILPDASLALIEKTEPEPDVVAPAFNVLFLCTRNSARSIMAEALLAKIGKGRFNVYSAGSDPAEAPMQEVLDRLSHLGHDIAHLRCKSWDEFAGSEAPRMDFVIALCDTPQGQSCPDLGKKFVTGAWPLPDPAQFTGSESERTTLLNELYAMIRRRIEVFVSLPFAALDRMALKARLDEIGDTTRVTP
ncbi:metalloregulator ArsR/SmtB family transcription factor [Afipia birgiae]|jgi:ArsR family transcriptional regulator, arsenate/arsenite/antimonite-responsive transcriptional repressor / arsenate reductase (thioredoxin)|uniref:metalloregulator ArsR/SmtB family transcription factor n=1 Tax=Afipia birgiae TaxID=151414 RepID=UPI00036F2705|nr:metalloregulator ArsR/SmtB family transcription factor [Afipia birgiae]